MGTWKLAMTDHQIDREKLRGALRTMSDEQIYYMLDEAIELLSKARLFRLVKRYLDPTVLRPGFEASGNLLVEVKSFEKGSLAGEYYEDFAVNSKNCTEMSKGTRAWIARCRRLLDRCVIKSRKGEPAEVHEAFEIIFGLLDHIEECLDDVVFFADEGGSWQVGVNWEKVLPAWFACLAATAEPEEYARRIDDLLSRRYNHRRQEMLAVASKMGTPAQRQALSSGELSQ
jgi:hypothetical protein